MTQNYHDDWTLVCHLNYGTEGKLTTVKKTANGFVATPVESSAANGAEDPANVKVFLGVEGDAVLLMDQISKEVSTSNSLPLDADPSYAYPDYANNRLWFVNDGDKETGNDPVCCDNNGSPVTIVEPGVQPNILSSICVGRGHHVATFIPAKGERQALAFVSNLLDGSIFVFGNDSAMPETFLKVIGSINLCEADKEKEEGVSLPNNAFPHGMIYSNVTDRVYNLNNGYGNIAVIDPNTMEIEQRISMKKCSNLLMSPNQRFAIGKGADRKSNPEHVMGRITVVNLEEAKVIQEIDVQDIYPTTYRFSPDGNKLYVTTAATGKGDQKTNLDMNSVLVYDTSNLPNISLIKTIAAGKADCGRRPLAYTEANGKAQWLFIPNPSDGTLSIIDSATDEVIDTVTLGQGNIKEVLFSFWHSAIKGS